MTSQPFLALVFFLALTGRTSADYPDWKHSGSMFILTTPEGANLPASASVDGFPLLVRLHQDFFDFSQAKANGEDLRFASAKGETLPYQIEQWDAAKGIASIWVRVPKITGNTSQELKLYWGKADAKSESEGRAVFNESNGYVSVWHLNESIEDEVGTLTSVDTGTTSIEGIIGRARRFPGQKGIFGGEKIPNYPSGANSHSTEAWFRAEKSNATIIGWGNEGGGRGSKVRMQLRSPPHLHIDSDFSDIRGEGRVPLGEWVHVVHTYNREDGKIYLNGRLNASAKPLLNIKTPSRLWIGGWYHNYDFVGDLDEVRISKVARSADWIRLQYENQKPLQTLVGHLVQPGKDSSMEIKQFEIDEGKSAVFKATAGGARKVYWIVKRDGVEKIAATDRFSFTFEAGRVNGDQRVEIEFRAFYANPGSGGSSLQKKTDLTIKEAIPEPVFTLSSPTEWDGRKPIEIVPQIANQKEMDAKGAGKLNYHWTVSNLAVIKEISTGKLILKRAMNSGQATVTLTLDNGGKPTVQSQTIVVKEPTKDAWVARSPANDEKPEDGQFFARDDKNEGTLFYNGTLSEAAQAVFLKLYADEKLVQTLTQKPGEKNTYTFTLKLKPGLIKYKVEFGSKTGEAEKVLHTVSNLICGDAFLIDGQSNAEATDVGKEDPPFTSEWIRSFGSMGGDPNNARLKKWGNAVVRDRNGGKFQIGSWGMELAKQLVENQKMPICIINGAVGGSRIDQHQPNSLDPTDAKTIYGRLLWRVQQAKLTHGIRGVLWHQGENDQGADGPTGGYGWETYQQLFIDMAGAWKEDYPNIMHYYLFQIWPKACAMGINGSDNRLREIQRTLPSLFSNMRVMSTLGIKPPGGCHFPPEGYTQFARLIGPLVELDHYGKVVASPITAPNLQRAYYTSDKKDEIAIEFDQPVKWLHSLASEFYLDGEKGNVASGAVTGNVVRLKLSKSSRATKLTYLDSSAWSQDRLLWGDNGIAALTFCDVPILFQKPESTR